jgi:hypothetical protein
MRATQLPPGTRLYRGDTPLYRRGAQPGTAPFHNAQKTVFFTTEAKHAKQYGVIWEFTTTVPLHLVDLSKFANMQALYRHAQEHGDNDIVHILERDFGYKSGIRGSETSANDTRVAEYIASLGDDYDGYILSKSVKTAFGGSFHPEVVLSKKQASIVLERVISSEEEVDVMIDKERELIHAQSLKAARETARKSRRQSRRDSSPERMDTEMETETGTGMGALMFDSPPSSPVGMGALTFDSRPSTPTTPKKNMYRTPGGGKTKRRRRRRQRRTRKAKST